MRTEAQLKTNRENSRKSTGPTSYPHGRLGGKMGSFAGAQAISFSSGWTSKLGSFGKSASTAPPPHRFHQPSVGFDEAVREFHYSPSADPGRPKLASFRQMPLQRVTG